VTVYWFGSSPGVRPRCPSQSTVRAHSSRVRCGSGARVRGCVRGCAAARPASPSVAREVVEALGVIEEARDRAVELRKGRDRGEQPLQRQERLEQFRPSARLF
jgi:hypothetical protein